MTKRSGRRACARAVETVALFGSLLFGLGFSPAFRDDPKPEQDVGSASEAKPASSRTIKLDYIDALIEDAWKEAKVKPSPPASDAEFLRRVYLDLTGRIPNVKEAVAFLDAKESGKRQKLVENLINSPDYSKNMGSLWSILLVGRRPQGQNVSKAALESWLRKQFAANRPWNEVVSDLVTASGSSKDNGATHFTMAHMQDGAINLTSITTRVFLGQQIQCTQCHDHPQNDWKQADFWGINAFFKGIRTRQVFKADATGAEVLDYVELFDEPTNSYSTYEKRNAQIGIAFPAFLDGRKISQGTDVDRRAELGKFITRDNPQLARAFVNRVWGHLLGRGFVQPVDDFGDHNPPSHPELLDRLAADFRASGYDVRALIRWITASRAYNLTSVTLRENEKDETLFSHAAVKPMTPEQLFDSLITATAAHRTAGENMDRTRDQWLRQFVVTFANDEEGESANFQGTIPQALMMMNGELMARATGGQSGSFLGYVFDRARQSRAPAQFIVNQLYLAAFCRYPSRGEMASVGQLLGTNIDSINLLQDLFWAMLNSNEFVLNH